jgi:hypothetical protein
MPGLTTKLKTVGSMPLVWLGPDDQQLIQTW